MFGVFVLGKGYGTFNRLLRFVSYLVKDVFFERDLKALLFFISSLFFKIIHICPISKSRRIRKTIQC